DALLGPRIGLGLCLGEVCLAAEGDVPILTSQTAGCDGAAVEYRPVSLGLRLSWRPVNVDDTFFFGGSLGITSRFGILRLPSEAGRLATDVGVRAGVELAWRISSFLELALDLGGDVYASPARFVRPPVLFPDISCPPAETVLVEDLVTLWGALVIRVRP